MSDNGLTSPFDKALKDKEQEGIDKCITYLKKKGYTLSGVKVSELTPEKKKKIVKEYLKDDSYTVVDVTDEDNIVKFISSKILGLSSESVENIVKMIPTDALDLRALDANSINLLEDDEVFNALCSRESALGDLIKYIKNSGCGLNDFVSSLILGDELGSRINKDEFLHYLDGLGYGYSKMARVIGKQLNNKDAGVAQ